METGLVKHQHDKVKMLKIKILIKNEIISRHLPD